MVIKKKKIKMKKKNQDVQKGYCTKKIIAENLKSAHPSDDVAHSAAERSMLKLTKEKKNWINTGSCYNNTLLLQIWIWIHFYFPVVS